jgi:CHAD domain-containing protein
MAVDAKGRPPGSLALIRMLQEQTAVARTELAGHVRPLAEILPASLLAGLWRPRHTGVPAADRCVRVRLGELAQRVAMLIPVACVEGRGGVQHHLRIRCKALRYSLEMMEWRLGSEASWRLGTLRKIQDELGELHDIDVFWGYLEERSGQNAIRRPGRLRDLVRGLEQERHRRFEGFLDLREGLEKVLAPITF